MDPMELTIYVDRLKDGQEEMFAGELSPNFLGDDPEFQEKITISGKAYVTGEHLILRLQAQTSAQVPCSICNELVTVPLHIENFYHAEPLADISSVFDFTPLVREDLLLQLPQFAECGGRCPERENLKQILNRSSKKDSQDMQFPFSHL